MDSGGGTGAPEQVSESDSEDPVREGVEIIIETLPSRTEILGTPLHPHINTIHIVRIRTAAATLTFEQAGYNQPRPDLLLAIADDLIRSARSRLSRGVVQITSL